MRSWIPAALAIPLATAAAAETPVTGDVTTDTVWSASGSPYVVQASFDVTNASVLTIEPGVTVAFDGFYVVRASGGSAVVAVGTSSQPILFTSNRPSPAPDDWIWWTVSGSDASIFEWCIFEYARTGLEVEESDIPVANCTFRHCQMYGLLVKNASPVVSNCNFRHDSTGLYLSDSTGSTLPVIHGCNFEDNTYYCLYLGGYDTPPLVTIDAEDNWWGTTDPVAIEAEIRHDVDQGDIRAHVDFDPWRGTVPVARESWGALRGRYAR